MTTTPGHGVDVRLAAQRAATDFGWLDSKHSFSFGQHYDADNTHFGLLLVNNDDIVAPGTGFETHPHRDMEIVTWVLRGALVHQDSQGHNGLIYPGLAQRMSAGTGILHSEKNDERGLAGAAATGEALTAAAGIERVHFVQMWVLPDEVGIAPGYEQQEISDDALRGGLVPVASGRAEHRDAAAIRIAQRNAALLASRMGPGDTVIIPHAPFVHVFVAEGSVDLEGTGPLDTGDAARISGGAGQRVTAGPAGAEILVWEMHAQAA